MTDRLIEIVDVQKLIELRDLYRKIDWPVHCVGFYCLDNYIRWRRTQKCSIANLNIYTLDNANAKSEGLFLIRDRYQLFIGTLNKGNLQNLEKALNLLDWSGGFKISSFLECYRPAVLNVIQTKQLNVEYDSLTLMYFMLKEQALKLEVHCPKGYYLTQLKADEHAHIINNHWPNRHQGSLFLIQRLINWNPNMGICVKDTNELVAWCLRLQGGFLGALQVKDQYKRLGLGSVVTCAIAHLLAQQGHDVMALVNSDNKPSCGLFNSLGFTITDNCYWLRTYPTIENYKWPDEC